MIPTPAEIRALLDSTSPPLSGYAAATLAGVKPRQMQSALTGERALSLAAWRLLQVTVSKRARKELPKPIAP
jgi:hypothetical protein